MGETVGGKGAVQALGSGRSEPLPFLMSTHLFRPLSVFIFILHTVLLPAASGEAI